MFNNNRKMHLFDLFIIKGDTLQLVRIFWKKGVFGGN